MIHAHELVKSFGATRVLAGVNLDVAAGELLALLGPNGSGKTTTVRILTTLLRADSGTATVAGHDVAREAAAVRRSIGLTAQHATVDEMLTGRENLDLFAGLNHLGRAVARRCVAELLDRFDLASAADRGVRTYSGGMRRRLDLAASMVAAPRILFLDEPTTGLDPRSRAELWTVIRELLASGTTILLTTQYLEEADQLADRIAVIHDGRIVADDTPAALKRQVGSERLVLLLAHDGDIAHASTLLSAEPGREMTVPLHSPDHLRNVLNRLGDAGIELEHVELRTPTLDDVFFEMTDKPTDKSTDKPTDKSTDRGVTV
ncbi:MAG TPA: ATP-binding cassette domain-containing protein [Candidatus Limnocylindrales bacterium]